eukprot:GHVU01190933.1.p2 GENE.GHVU01190933.1~~GHVU01190933.1.p2  ORF type:complete len:141 (+),score=23.24 GHVU01190933.1:1334-1756(+)
MRTTASILFSLGLVLSLRSINAVPAGQPDPSNLIPTEQKQPLLPSSKTAAAQATKPAASEAAQDARLIEQMRALVAKVKEFSEAYSDILDKKKSKTDIMTEDIKEQLDKVETIIKAMKAKDNTYGDDAVRVAQESGSIRG